MSEPFVGEIRLMPYRRNITNWHACDGTLLQINNYKALFALIGNTYGGDGKTTFALPDLRGRTPVSVDNPMVHPNTPFTAVGASGGAEGVVLTTSNVPPHQHTFGVYSQTGEKTTIGGNTYASAKSGVNVYGPPSSTNLVPLVADTMANAGLAKPHENRQYFQVLAYYIALNGFFPSPE